MADYVLEIVEGPEAGRQIPLAGPVELEVVQLAAADEPNDLARCLA